MMATSLSNYNSTTTYIYCKNCNCDKINFSCLTCNNFLCALCKHLHFSHHKVVPFKHENNVENKSSYLPLIPVKEQYAGIIKCNYCPEEYPAKTFCISCTVFLCVLCDGLHSRMPSYEKHQIIQVSELRMKTPTSSLEVTEEYSLVKEISKILIKESANNLQTCNSPVNSQPVVVRSPARPILSPSACNYGSVVVTPVPSPAVVTSENTSYPSFGMNSMQIYKAFGQQGVVSGQFNSPHGFCLGFNEDIVVADTVNHRIQIFDKSGNYKHQFGLTGKQDGHLWFPRKVAVLLKQKKYVVCDHGHGRSRMQLFTIEGKFFKKICIQYINILAGVTVTGNEEIVIVDSVTPTVFILGHNDFLRSIDCSKWIQEPSDIAELNRELFICDFKGHYIVVMNMEGQFLRQFGNEGIFQFPNGIDIIDEGNLVVGDSHGNFLHITVFSKLGELIIDYRCGYMKVSRCCGLKLNSVGNLITVDKNFHHVIMLNAPQLKKSLNN